MASISLTMIVRNEEATLPGALCDVIDLVDDVVVVDTGSADGTREIARGVCPRAKVVDFPWCDDFSAARNEALCHAQGEWVFWIDADDRIDESSRNRLGELFDRLPADNTIYTMPYVSRTPWCENIAPVVPYQRLFRNHRDIRWVGRVYETLQSTNPHLKCTNLLVDIPIYHHGYADLSRFVGKLERNQRLFLLEQQELLSRLNSIAYRVRQTDETLPNYHRLVEIEKLLCTGADANLAREREELKRRLTHPNDPRTAANPESTTVIVV
jgi:glycosyltransferase involved in cell wall biosynthesis